MSNAISSIASSHAGNQPQQTAPAKPSVHQAAPQPKGVTVTISAQAKHAAVPLRTAGSTPAEELKESPIQKAVEANQGKM